MARGSESDMESGGGTLELRRVAVALAAVAAHIALIFVMWRGAKNSAEVLDITLVALPITPEDGPREPAGVSEPPISRAAEIRPRNASVARSSANVPPHVERSLAKPRSEAEVAGNKVAAGAGSPSEPAAPVDWYAEAKISADALVRRESVDRERRSLGGPKQQPSSARHLTPACPFEKCEPNWGANFSIFQSQFTKSGRIEKTPPVASGHIEKTPDGEMVRWFNNRCYQVLVTADKSRRNMPWCFIPLGKSAARGDLFEHMNESPPPGERATDVP